MKSVMLSLNVVFPMIALISVGYILKLLKMVDDHSLTVINKVAFRAFISSMLFVNIYDFELEFVLRRENFDLFAFTFVCFLLEILISFLFFKKLSDDPKKRSVMMQGVFRTNLILFGIAITMSLYDGSTGVTSLLAALMVPAFNIGAVVVLETHRGGNIDYKKILLGILINPLILAAVFGFFFVVTGIKLPKMILTPLNQLKDIATPLSFIILGGTLKFSNLIKNLKYIVIVNFMRLVILPIVFIALAIKFGFRNEALIGIFAVLGTPTAVSSFNMAKDMDADGDLAGEIVVTTSVVSFVTTFLWIIFLKNYGFI